MDQQLTVDWPALLDGIARTLNPIHDQIFQAHPTSYYWSTFQSEWAVDIVFRTASELRRIYPRLLQHATATFGSADVMRFFGRRIPLCGDIPKRFAGQVVSDLHERQEGVRIEHRLNDNSGKLYDKAFTIIAASCAPKARSTTSTFVSIDPSKAHQGHYRQGELAGGPREGQHRPADRQHPPMPDHAQAEDLPGSAPHALQRQVRQPVPIRWHQRQRRHGQNT
jgi:hypothetical protein